MNRCSLLAYMFLCYINIVVIVIGHVRTVDKSERSRIDEISTVWITCAQAMLNLCRYTQIYTERGPLMLRWLNSD